VRVLTVRQPWALHIVQSGKDVENRVRNVVGAYRGPVAIHAGLRTDDDALRRLPARAPNGIPRVFDTGVIIGVVDITDVHHADTCRGTLDEARKHEAIAATRDPDLAAHWHERYCSPWAQAGTQHIVLANPRQLRRPVPFRGALGLRTLDQDVVKAITRSGYLATLTPGATA
jgi:hypothetical protein